MATDQERLLLLLEANTRNFERSLEQSERLAERRFAAIEKRANQMVQKTQRDWNNFANQARTAFAALAVGTIARDVVSLADVWTTVGNRIAFAGVAQERVAATQQAVADIASRTRSDLDATADLFARMYRSSEDLGASQERVLRVTELVSKALAGAAQSERQGAIRQLGQGLGSGRLQGDELRSILENSRPIAEAIAAEFNTTVGNLRNLGKEGVLESRRVFEAIERAGADIDATFARTNFTVADSFVRLRTEAARFVGTNEQTAGSVRGLTKLIDAVADNFDLLADAVVIAATVLGGTFAGLAIARASAALVGLVTEMTTVSTRAAAMQKAFAFFGGPLGIALTVAGGAMAYFATQTDLFTSSVDLAARGADSAYSALQLIASLEPVAADAALASENLADQNQAVAERADQATAAIDAMTSSTSDSVGVTNRAAEAEGRLAEQMRLGNIQRLERARNDQIAIQDGIRRDVTLRSIGALSQSWGMRPIDASAFGLTPEEQQRIEESQQLLALFTQSLADLRANRAQAPSDPGGNSPTDPTGDPNARRQALDDLQRQAELTLARLRHEEQRVVELEDAEQIEKRTAAYVQQGVALTIARQRAETEVRTEREAMNAEAQRSYQLDQQQHEIELARLANNIGLADAMSDQLDIARQTREIAEQLHISEEEAAERARQRVQERRDAINRQREISLQTRDLETQADAARLAGDERRENFLRRELELRQRIEQLRAEGMSEGAAIARAETELATLEDADLRGKFRDWFSGGVMAALDGDLDDFFENWIRERAAKGLENALDSVADILFDSFSGVLSSVMRSGEDGIGQAIAAVFAGGATGGLNRLGEESQKAGEALGTVLAAGAAHAASQIALTGVAAAASATREASAASVKQTAASIELNAMAKLAVAANAAAGALARIAAAEGGSKSSLGSSLIGAVLSVFTGGNSGSTHGGTVFGGFRAGGGPMAAGVGYIVGERGRELVIPQTPSFAVPNTALGGGNVTVVDRTVINVTGASTAEVAQLRATLRQDLATRRQTTVQIVRDAARRPRGLG